MRPRSTAALTQWVPVEPGREQARGWAIEELAGREYAAQRPGLVERAITWLLDQLDRLSLPTAPGSALALTVTLAVIGVGLAVVIWRARGLAGRRAASRDAAVLTGPARPASAYRAASQAHAEAHRWTDAVLDRFRAIARELEERAILDPQPGRTADEVSAQSARWLPALASDLTGGARIFDDVAYGDRVGTASAYDHLVRLDEAVRTQRTAAAGGVAGPAPAGHGAG